ncbi:hypothetical protein NLI96_g8406 [Meripilus lineatus]|uniref:Non-specific serine/threonine protein kinase n=1 Tax=Meripilus lineatus TaxID=2056292 RepID=A0AAD5YC07_9APHY|nr:hypothetical protein NLI96_g8406 [Physisporinus lineatus]
MGTGKNADFVNVIDFGLAKKFRDPRTGLHIPYRQDEYHGVGTSLFAAINTHLGMECSRRDDLESLAYMLIYFMRGTLPWRKLKGQSTTETWDLIKAKKIETASLLTIGLPPEFEIFYTYVRGLEFGDLPDYEGLRGLLRGLAEREGIEYDGEFDWVVGGGVRKGKGKGKVKGLAEVCDVQGGKEEGRERKKRRFCRACDACEERERERLKEKERKAARW